MAYISTYRIPVYLTEIKKERLWEATIYTASGTEIAVRTDPGEEPIDAVRGLCKLFLHADNCHSFLIVTTPKLHPTYFPIELMSDVAVNGPDGEHWETCKRLITEAIIGYNRRYEMYEQYITEPAR